MLFEIDVVIVTDCQSVLRKIQICISSERNDCSHTQSCLAKCGLRGIAITEDTHVGNAAYADRVALNKNTVLITFSTLIYKMMLEIGYVDYVKQMNSLV